MCVFLTSSFYLDSFIGMISIGSRWHGYESRVRSVRKRTVVLEKVQMEVTIGSDYVFLYKKNRKVEIAEEMKKIPPERLYLVLFHCNCDIVAEHRRSNCRLVMNSFLLLILFHFNLSLQTKATSTLLDTFYSQTIEQYLVDSIFYFNSMTPYPQHPAIHLPKSIHHSPPTLLHPSPFPHSCPP